MTGTVALKETIYVDTRRVRYSGPRCAIPDLMFFFLQKMSGLSSSTGKIFLIGYHYCLCFRNRHRHHGEVSYPESVRFCVRFSIVEKLSRLALQDYSFSAPKSPPKDKDG